MGNSQTKAQSKGRNKKQVHWKAAEHPGPPGKPELVPGSDITPDVVTIRWDKPKSDGGSPVIGFLVEHRRTGSPHWVRATPLLVPVPELTLSGLEPGWRYQFRVSAQNAVGLSEPGEISEPLTVTLQRSIITAPKFTEELQDKTSLENEMAEFVVHVIGQPVPKICWFKDGFEIFSSRRTRITTENGKSVLTIHQVALSDEGEIKCTATNRAGHSSTKASIKVEAPPKIRLPRQYEEGLLFELDEVIRLKVSIAGRPQPLVFWSHNGESIQNDDRYELINSDKSSVLRVGEAKRSDRGEYQIRAVNKLGEDTTSFLVTVTDKPKPPGDVRVVMSLGKTVTLGWSLPEDDGGCKIGNYIVEYFRVGWNVWLKAATCRQLTYTLSDLIEGSEYKFRVKAESPYGVSDPSDETDVIFIPDPKRGMLSPPQRSRSQPRESVKEASPVPPKRRSASSTRNSGRETNQINIPANVPVRPKRERIKSPPKTPEMSPELPRRPNKINATIYDRESIARELSYGSPDVVKTKKSDAMLQTEPNDLKIKPPSPRNKSPSRINTILSNILPKKSPSPSKLSKESSPAREAELKRSPSPKNLSISNTIQNLSPSPVDQRRSSSPVDNSKLNKSPVLDMRRASSPVNGEKSSSPILSSIENILHRRRSQTPSPSPSRVKEKSPSPSKLSTASDSRRNSTQSKQNNNDMQHGSSEFMLVLFPEHGDKYYADHEGSSYDYFNFGENSIPPPMSLSAPELGSDPAMFEPLRTSVSSSEILHERAMTRFRIAAELEEESKRKKSIDGTSAERKTSLDDQETKDIYLEDLSQERRVSIPKILINSKDNEDIVGLERKTSFKRRLSAGVNNLTQQYLWAKRRQSLRNTGDFTDLPESKLKSSETSKKCQDLFEEKRSPSEEREAEDFARIRNKLANNSENKNNVQNNKRESPIDEVEKNKEIEEEASISEEDFMSSDDERLNYDTVPPNIEVKEEEIYHPRAMIVDNQAKHKEPFEILTKPSPLPDPNFIPKPILKKNENKKKSPDKPVRKTLIGTEGKRGSFSLLPPFRALSKSRSPSPSNEKKNSNRSDTPVPSIPAESQVINAAEAARSKRMLNRQNSEEENKVIADRYGDIVSEYSRTRRVFPPYKGPDEQKTSPAKDDEEEVVKEYPLLEPRVVNFEKERTPSPEKRTWNTNEPPPPLIIAPPVVKKESPISRRDASPAVRSSRRDPSPAVTSRRDPSPAVTSFSRRDQSPAVAPYSRRDPSPAVPPISRRDPSPAVSSVSRKDPTASVSPVAKRDQSPSVTSRRPLGVGSTTRTRSTSRTRPSRKVEPPSEELQNKLDQITRTPSPRPLTPEQEIMQAEAEIKVRSTVDYMTDVAMFFVACWLYFFKDARLAIPILIIMVYRQIKDEIKKAMPSWLTKKQ